MLPEPHRLKEKRDFRRIYQRGKSQAYPCFVLYYLRSRYKPWRVGFSVSKKLGGAVCRNRIKRRFRELCRLMPEAFSPHHDYIFVVRSYACRASSDRLASEIKEALAKIKNPARNS